MKGITEMNPCKDEKTKNQKCTAFILFKTVKKKRKPKKKLAVPEQTLGAKRPQFILPGPFKRL